MHVEYGITQMPAPPYINRIHQIRLIHGIFPFDDVSHQYKILGKFCWPVLSLGVLYQMDIECDIELVVLISYLHNIVVVQLVCNYQHKVKADLQCDVIGSIVSLAICVTGAIGGRNFFFPLFFFAL